MLLTAAFGLRVELDLPHPELNPPDALPAGRPMRATLASAEAIDAAWSGAADPPLRAGVIVDAIPWTLERGRDDDRRVVHGATRLHLDAGATVMLCAPEDPASAAWQRVLLDTALVTASLARGLEALHAGAVAVGSACVALLGARGAGKTTLTLELVRRGAEFVADDVVALARDEGGSLVAHLAPSVANLPATMAAHGIGEVLHDFGDELWVRVDHAAQRPRPLTAVVLIDRDSDQHAPRLQPAAEPAVALLSHALHSGTDPARRMARFALLADLAATTPVLRLEAAPGTPPAVLADLVTEELLA